MTPKTIGLVDLSALFKTRYHGGRPEEAALRVLGDLSAIRASVDHVILCLDAPPYIRKQQYAEYKAHREAPEAQELEQRRRLYDKCHVMGYKMAKCKGWEGDDVIATLARIYSERCAQVLIIGSDKDLAQCVTENVIQFVPGGEDKATEIRRGPKEVFDKFEVYPEQIPLYLALLGDKSDNIPGVKGIGKVKASALAHEFKTLQRLKDATVYRTSPNVPRAVWDLLAGGWAQLELGLKLTTLNDKLPLDADELLLPGEPTVTVEEQFPEPIIGADPNAGAFLKAFGEKQQEDAFEQAMADYDPNKVAPTRMTQVMAEIAERAIERKLKAAEPAPSNNNDGGGKKVDEKVTEAVFEEPAKKSEPPPAPAPAAKKEETETAMVKAKDYGMVTADLQPCDMRSALNLATFLFGGGMYAAKFKSAMAILTVIIRARELGIGITTALQNMHNVDGAIVMHADLIRAQAETHKDFDYLMPVKMSATSCTWVGKHKRQPREVEYTYTIEDAKIAGLLGRKPWRERPQDMLVKTAGSKLARLLWPGAVAGIYCPEEMDKDVETYGEEVAA